MIVLILLMMGIATYGNFVLTGVAEEKSSRVVEVVLARTPARHLFAGKVAGIGALGLTQLVLFAAGGLLALRLVPEIPGRVPTPSVEAEMVIGLVVWFVLGYAFYATAYGAIGALTSRIEDAQNAAGPLLLGLLGAYFFVFIVTVNDPAGLASRIASFVPITAPFVMPARTAMGEVGRVEALIAGTVMLTATYGLMRVAGRVLRGRDPAHGRTCPRARRLANCRLTAPTVRRRPTLRHQRTLASAQSGQ